MGAVSVSMPLISSGIFGAPVEFSIAATLQAVEEHSRKQRSVVRHIILVHPKQDVTKQILD